MTDESGQSYPYTIDTLLDKAIGPEGYYGVFTVNAHTDVAESSVSDAVVNSALVRGIPVVSARQMLTWLDGRNSSTFNSVSWNGNTLSFTVSAAQGANGLTAMAPAPVGQMVSGITKDGSSIPFTTAVIKGIQYARFLADSGAYQVSYATDIIPPAVTSVTPAAGATNIGVTTNPAVTFSKALDPATVTAATFELRDPLNNLVSATITYDPSTRIAKLTPAAVLANSTVYTATVKGGASGVKDLTGNPLAADYTWSFFTTIAASTKTYTLWPSTTIPGTVDIGTDNALELGVKFYSDTSGYITGIRFYKSSDNTDVHVGNLWTSNGTLLATEIFTNETASGWQQVNFSTPVAITANTVYVASYHTNVGHYSDDVNYFAGKGVDSPPLHAPADGVSGSNGVYAYGDESTFPNQSLNSSNYWVDAVFVSTVMAAEIPAITDVAAVATTLSFITIAPGGQMISVGDKHQFTAIGTYSDGSKKDLTGKVSWVSSNTNAVAIGKTGLATGISPGKTTISATFNGITGNTGLTALLSPG
jgi:hypothetical protein